MGLYLVLSVCWSKVVTFLTFNVLAMQGTDQMKKKKKAQRNSIVIVAGTGEEIHNLEVED